VDEEKVTIDFLGGWWYIISSSDGVIGRRWPTLEIARHEYFKLCGKDWIES